MPSDGPIRLLIIGILILLAAFFSASETAFTSCNRIRMIVKAEDGNRSAKLVVFILKRLDNSLVTILILINLVQVALSTLATVLFVTLFNSAETGSLVATIVITAVIFIIGDSIPKSFARAKPDTVAMINSYFAIGLIILMYPISFIFQMFNRLLQKIFKMPEGETITEEDLSNVVESIEEQGGLDADESEIIQSAIEFDTVVVADILTPAEKIYALDITNLTHQKLQEAILNSSYSRIPLYRGTLNNVVGVIFVRTYLRQYFEDPKISIRKTLTKPYFTSPNVIIDDLLEGFKKHSTHVAFVKDDDGKVLGMITMEDVLEEIVGMTDEKTKNALGEHI